MKTLLLALLLSFNIFAQVEMIIMMRGSGTSGSSIDTIPSQFTFTDVTDAALSSYNQAYFIVAGCDSARFYPATGDSLKLGVLGTYDVSPIWADVGDSIYTGLVASVSNSTATHSIIYSSNGTPLDTFSVTTVAGGDTLDINLFNNSTFEAALSGTTDWEEVGTATVIRSDEQAYAGTYSGKVTSSENVAGIRYVNNGNWVAVDSGATYWVEGYYYLVSGGADISAGITLPFGYMVLDVTNQWTYFKLQLVAESTYTIFGVTLRSATATTFYLDNVTIKKKL